jgi:hypothetical protein
MVVRLTVRLQEAKEHQRRQVVDGNPGDSVVLWCADRKAFRRGRKVSYG